MNTYYIFAIICLALSAYLGYQGSNYESKKSNDQQLSKISEEFQNLGQQIIELKETEVSTTQLEEIDEKYKDLAQQYMKVLPAEAQSIVVEQEEYKLEQFNISKNLIPQINIVRETAKNLVAAFSSEGADIHYQDMAVPANLFSNEPFALRLNSSGNEYWSIHLVDREPGKIGVMFVKIKSQDNGSEILTNDSIVFRWYENEKFAFSLNSRIGEEVKKKVFDKLDNNYHPIAEANTQIEALVLNLIKYILAKSELNKA